MKSAVLYAVLLIAILVSVFFTYQRSFVWKNFELIDSEAETVQEEMEATEEAEIEEMPPMTATSTNSIETTPDINEEPL